MLLLGFMHRFGFKLMYGGQKWALWPSFDQQLIFTWDLIELSTW